LQTYSINLPNPPRALLEACDSARLTAPKQNPLSADVVIWEASERAFGRLTPQQAELLCAGIQKGGRLLLTLDAFPGITPLLLRGALPTTGWATQLRASAYAAKDALRVARTDGGFFRDGLEGLQAPFCFDIRPTSAVERGQARYERYSFVHPVLHVPVQAGSDFWSRSLLNREWMARAQCDDVAQMPLVMTSRYGAGRVAVLATSAEGIGESDAARRLWEGMLRWLTEGSESTKSDQARPGIATSFSPGKLQVKLSNPDAAAAMVQVVVRVSAGDGAILADARSDAVKTVRPGARDSAAVLFELPAASLIGDESVTSAGPLRVRVGVLSGDGATLLEEQRLVTQPAAVQMRIQTDNLYSLPYPFHAPGPDALTGFQARMGAATGAYAYAPGATVHGSVSLLNGLENLAPLSAVEDLTTAGNLSVMGLNDEATGILAGPSPDKIEAYAAWIGKAGVENAIQFTLPEGAQVSQVTIVGTFGNYGNGAVHSPGQAVVEMDGRGVGAIDDLDAALTVGYGQVRISFPPSRGSRLTVRLPWVPMRNGVARQEPWLGEIRVYGWRGDAPREVSGSLVVNLVDALSGRVQQVVKAAVTVGPCSMESRSFACSLPEGGGLHFYRLEASLAEATAAAPVLVLTPGKTLLPLSDLRPANGPGTGLNVSRGFREIFHLGTGTAEPTEGWSSPDDLIWAYSRQLKQIPKNAGSGAARLYVSESDMRHYITPWCSFSNGELFMPVAAPLLVENLKNNPKWSTSNLVQVTFADRWDTGPDMANLHGWQDFVEFDKYLRASGGSGLTGRTHQEVETEIEKSYSDQWQGWQLERYIRGIRSLREAFESAGKQLVINSQGVPMVAGEAGRELSLTIRGMADDCTWSMLDNSPVFTTGRQMCELAFNPVWRMSTSVPWGFNSAIFNNWQWHHPVGTTEPSRRHIYDRAWRGTVWPGGAYGSVYTYGLTANVGVAYTLTEEDFQQWWYAQERQCLIAPEMPLGAGLVISTSKSADPRHVRFTCGDPLTLDEPRMLAQSFRNLHNAGVSVPFAMNASCLHDYALDAPLILLNPEDFSEGEIQRLAALHADGIRLAAFAERRRLSGMANDLFMQPGTLLIEKSAATLTRAEAVAIAAQLQQTLNLVLQFPEGTAGYGFRCQDTSFIVVEDWLEQGRRSELRVMKSRGARSAAACNVNDHRTLTIRDGGDAWLVDLPLRSGDGVLIALKENPSES